MRVLIVFLVLLLSLPSFPLFAEATNEVEFNEELIALKVDYALSPNKKLEALETLILLAESNDWRHSEIRSQVYKAEILISLEQIQSAQKIVDLYLPRTKAAHLLESRARLQLVQITINTTQNKPTIDLINNIEENILLIENEKVVADLNSGLGIAFYTIRNNESALKHLENARKIYKKMGDEIGLSETLNSLANIFSDESEPDIAIQYLSEALKVMRKFGDKHGESILLYNLAQNYIAKQDFEEAQKSLASTLKLNQELDDIAGIAWTNHSLGLVFEEQNNYEKALLYYQQALVFFKDNNDKTNIINVSLGKINCLIELEQSNEANQELLVLKPIIDEYKDEYWQAPYQRLNAKLYALNNDYKAAYETQVEVTNRFNDRYKSDANNDIQELLIKFDLNKKANDNRILQQENELQELRLKQKQKESTIWRMAMAFAVLIMVLIGYLLQRILVNRNHFQEMALKDHLTGAPNRRAILEFAERQYQLSKRNRTPLTVAIIDLDFFKSINDNYGHDVGDEVLKAFSTAISSSIRSQDQFGRYGGEEWLLVLTNTPVEDVSIIFERITKNLSSIEVDSLPAGLKITFSLGAAQVDKKDTTVNKTINRADTNLYQAKESGRNKAIF
ncbi:diguanylate cyclase [Psychrosphaera haliotis]|uniref:diguanylate cyclase n=1 Tax=Psychrosphaera haliotis TaxID=555083 RepID=A0A6N8FD32_9GAMM|nr:diguanylate cyclase [Psychrosphaera haliotis]MUH72221.1 diguanylate cyclase [Psychrosphaera haliotis]